MIQSSIIQLHINPLPVSYVTRLFYDVQLLKTVLDRVVRFLQNAARQARGFVSTLFIPRSGEANEYHKLYLDRHDFTHYGELIGIKQKFTTAALDADKNDSMLL